MNEAERTSADGAHRDLQALAEEQLGRGERRAAAASLERAMQLDPTDDDAPLLAAGILFEEGEPGRAADLALEAIGRRPFHPPALNLLGVACLDSGDVELARRVLRHVTRIAPGLESAQGNLRAAQCASVRSARQRRVPRRDIARLLRPRKPRLSVCVVVRDGAQMLGDCLSSFRGVASELIVVDATVRGELTEIERGPGTTLLRGLPEYDAAAWLDAARRRATGDWVLLVTPEERLPKEAVARLGRDMTSRSALFHVVETLHDRHGPWCRQVRLFRNAPGVRFSGRVRARVRPCLDELARKWGLAGADAAAVLRRAGTSYGDAAVSTAELDALAHAADRDLHDRPGDPRAWLQRASVDGACGAPESALVRLGHLAGALPAEGAEAEEAVTLAGRSLMQLGRFEDLSRRLATHHRHAAPTRNTLFLDGVGARALGDPGRAAVLLERCMHEPLRSTFVPPLPELLGAGLPTLLGAAMLDLGRHDAAREAFQEALSREPRSLEARLGLAGVQLAAGQIDSLLRELDELLRVHEENPHAWFLASTVLGHVPRLVPTAEQLLEEGCKRFPYDRVLLRKLGEARLRNGRAAAALEAWSSLESRTAPERAADLAACLVTGAELPPVDVEAREAVESEVLRWLQVWMDAAAWEILDRALVEIHRAAARLPGLPVRAADWLREIGQTDAADRIRDRCHQPA